jgi:hypothetical protein
MARQMIQGHVDRITRQLVMGWAADTAAPDERVDVAVYLNGRKLAQLAGDQPRADLRHKGVYGEGRHGFRYDFVPPLPTSEDARVAIRFAESGESLGNGNVLLLRGATEPTILPTPPLKAEQLIVPAPVDPRTLFRLFALYEPAAGLYPLLCRVDFGHVQPSHLDYAALGQVPDCYPRGLTWSPALARDYLNDQLHASRFQQNVLAQALRAFPEKQRLMFVHIPKCAGSDLSFHLAARFPSIEQRLMDETLTTREEMFEALANFARELGFSDSVFVRGHIPLDFYANAELIRPADRVFTIMRDPTEIALSQVNYILTKFSLNIEAGVVEADTRGWLDALELKDLPQELTPGFVEEHARRLLYDTNIVEPNSMCRWLGGGDSRAVVERLARYLVEVTDTPHYNAWLAERWGIASRTRQNESIKFLSLGALSHNDVGYLQDLSREDQKLYAWVQQALVVTGKSSVSGEDILNTLPPPD